MTTTPLTEPAAARRMAPKSQCLALQVREGHDLDPLRFPPLKLSSMKGDPSAGKWENAGKAGNMVAEPMRCRRFEEASTS